MASSYLLLALVLALSLNAGNRWLRAAGTALAATALAMIVVSILLADFDGTFANRPPPETALSALTPAILNVQAALAGGAVVFLGWAAIAQLRRAPGEAPPLRNTHTRFGRVSRTAHWATAVLFLAAVPMGMFVTVLPETAPERAEFAATHVSIGLTVLLVIGVRLAWLVASPPPPLSGHSRAETRAAHAVRLLLYALALALPVSGVLMSLAGGEIIALYGAALPIAPIAPNDLWPRLHGAILPLLLYAVLALHIGAAIKHHFADRDRAAIRRMLR
jgi:cytochrome b561